MGAERGGGGGGGVCKGCARCFAERYVGVGVGLQVQALVAYASEYILRVSLAPKNLRNKSCCQTRRDRGQQQQESDAGAAFRACCSETSAFLVPVIPSRSTRGLDPR